MVKYQQKEGIIFIDYVKSKGNFVDPLLNPFGRKMIHTTSRGMGLMPIMKDQQ